MGCFSFFSIFIIAAIIYHVIKALTKTGDLVEEKTGGWETQGTEWTRPAVPPPLPDRMRSGFKVPGGSVRLESRQGNLFARIQVGLNKALPDGLVVQSRLRPVGSTNSIAETFDSVFVPAGRAPDLLYGWVTPAIKHALVKAWTEAGGGFWLKDNHAYADIPVSGENDPKINIGVEVLREMAENMMQEMPSPEMSQPAIAPLTPALPTSFDDHTEPAKGAGSDKIHVGEIGPGAPNERVSRSGVVEKESLGPPPNMSGVPVESILEEIHTGDGMETGFNSQSSIQSKWSGRSVWGRGRIEYCRKIFGIDVDFGIPGGCKITVKPENQDSVLAPRILVHIPYLDKEVLTAGTIVAYSGKVEDYRPALRCLLLLDGRVQTLQEE